MIRGIARKIVELLPPGSRLAVVALAAESLIAGMLEAVVLVLVVSATLSTAAGSSAQTVQLPMLSEVDPSSRGALMLAGSAGLVILAMHIHSARLTARLSAELLRAVRQRTIVAYSGAAWERQARDNEGALQETVSTLSIESSALAVHLCNLLAASVGLSALVVAAVVVDPIVTLVMVGFASMIVLILRPIGRLTRARSGVYVTTNSAFTEGMSQWSSLAMDLRVFGVEGTEIDRLLKYNATTAAALTRSRFIGRVGSELYKDLAILAMIGAVAGVTLISDIDLASVGTVVLLVVRSLNYAQRTNATLQSINELVPNFDSLLARLESLEAAAAPVGALPLETITRIELRDVDYDYEPGRPGVRGITLDIDAGEAVGVVGPSGGGKSTLVQVLLRLRPPTRGTVRVSGIPYVDIEPGSWHRLVTLVPQEPRLFQGTVTENIAFLRAGITREQVEHAAAMAHVLDDIRGLPAGFDTQLGPRGTGLSGGQKQRIAIARALLGEPQMIVLDEPTSALDVRSEELLQETIGDLKGRVTLVIVAHRFTTLACCDRVIAMAEGRIQTIGTLEEALAKVSFSPTDE